MEKEFQYFSFSLTRDIKNPAKPANK